MDDREHVYDVDPSQNGLTGGEPGPEEQQWTQRGNEAAEQEDYAAAAEAFQQAVELNPNNARSRYNLALAQQFQGDTELAIAGYRRAIDLVRAADRLPRRGVLEPGRAVA